MEFTILSHACMLVKSQGTTLMIDPWLLGSAYWRSWWNYPKPSDAWRTVTNLDYIYGCPRARPSSFPTCISHG